MIDKKYERFDDQNTGLTFVKFDREHVENFTDWNAELDSWTADAGVQRFITGEAGTKLHNIFMDNILMDNYNHEDVFYVFEQDSLVGAIYLSSPDIYLRPAGFEYLVVSPNARNRGIATRIISSVKENMKYFFRKQHNGEIYASIHEDNIASNRAFLKSGFVVRGRGYCNNYNRLYCSPRQKEDDMPKGLYAGDWND